tara:strand:+ start:2826 stop:2990 length:165 start_codon:yes stop_codon:yes gene_type:complete
MLLWINKQKEIDMPYGKGTYGKMRGRPSKKKKAAMKKKMSPAMKKKMMMKKKKR